MSLFSQFMVWVINLYLNKDTSILFAHLLDRMTVNQLEKTHEKIRIVKFKSIYVCRYGRC